MGRFNRLIVDELNEDYCSSFECPTELALTSGPDNSNYFQQDVRETSFREYVLRDPLLYGDYRNAIKDMKEERFYEDLLDYEAIYFLFQEILDQHNDHKSQLNLVLFEHCLEHLTRIQRCLRMARGHVMLIGATAVGKKTLTQLATFAAGRQLHQINIITANYGIDEFRVALKGLFKRAGIALEQIVLLVNVNQVTGNECMPIYYYLHIVPLI